LAEGHSKEDLCRNDIARPVIIPRMLETMKQQNATPHAEHGTEDKSYSVIDGFPIDRRHVRIIPLDFRPWEIVFASDGYPFLCPTLEESEARLRHQRETDPLNIGNFKATKGFTPGNRSFDDRTYIRFTV
jgi:glycerophosphoryl diester phosphodiesterase